MTYGRISSELVSQAVVDRAEGNRSLTSKTYLNRRIAEIHYDQMKRDEEFQEWKKQFFTVKAWEENYGR